MSRNLWLPVLLCLALASALVVPNASAQLREYGVSLTAPDTMPNDGPYTTELDPVSVPVELEVTCNGPEVPAGTLEFEVNAVVEDAGASPKEEFRVQPDPATVEFFFDEQSCVTGEEIANETIQVKVTPGHLSIYDSPVQVLVWAETSDGGINESATFYVRPGLSGSVSVDFATTIYETDIKEFYNVTYKVVNDLNTEAKVTFADVPDGLQHEVLPAPFVACNTHAEGCNLAGLTGSFDVISPGGNQRVEETVQLEYTVTPPTEPENVIHTSSVNLTFVYDPAGSGDGGGGSDDEESAGAGFVTLLVVALLGMARIRSRRY